MFHFDLPNTQVQRLAVKLIPAAEKLVMQTAHPWVFSKNIGKINKPGKAGDIAILFRQKSNDVYGVGLYDPESPIQIKMLHYYSGKTIDKTFFSEKIDEAFALRKSLLATNTNSYRLLFGENDGFPGFIADVYANVMVVKLYSAIWFPYLKDILEVLIEVSGCETVVLRLSRNLQTHDHFGLQDGMVLYGTLENEEVEFVEHGVLFTANVIKGHKTGYFLDHRENRRRVGVLSKNKTVLDVFSYAGGFSVHALAGGAKEVTSVDISKQALELATSNAALNGYVDNHLTLAGDAFLILEQLIEEGRTYGVVVIDPPSFAKSQKEVSTAKHKYAQLARLGAKLVATKGILVLASCSSRVVAEDFFEINETALKASGRQFVMQDQTYHDSDHPITFKEGAYLKCGYYKFS
ncbi:class I SAM-dependent rRNA methyltransferase [Gelidibacter maritimus]|uniref:Class I SAM-dependent methyltransferase n=1 Tax=Gelidibacter maritimus TaxID=2761487 RepID=A0A7W2R4F9_9FLAO|nr:class I SAM-dependent rRNA methyltransferase [Gelidibacter maritimus]MBA6153055.1 class I SAM-dependent methyltransferase [Gelidibacter maritimus]